MGYVMHKVFSIAMKDTHHLELKIRKAFLLCDSTLTTKRMVQYETKVVDTDKEWRFSCEGFTLFAWSKQVKLITSFGDALKVLKERESWRRMG